VAVALVGAAMLVIVAAIMDLLVGVAVIVPAVVRRGRSRLV